MLKVKVFDESHETDLEDAINMFLEEMDEDSALVDIKYSISAFLDVGG
ncbi:TPA: sporulation protein Cse60, partial [bacterium]|nr:sporulation protein Cse60 [bacterium]